MGNQAIQQRGHIYRYVSFERAAEMFKSKTLFFARPRLWKDPYEVQLVHHGSDKLFAQCWCQTAISEAMWRLYSPGQDGVRIGTTKERLAAAVRVWTDANGLDFRDGPVHYDPAPEVRKLTKALGRRLSSRFDLRKATEALFFKREAYEHENEWRVVVYGEGITADANGLSIPIEPSHLINSVLLDPRAPEDLVQRRARYFSEVLGYTKKVTGSALDQPPEPIVVC